MRWLQKILVVGLMVLIPAGTVLAQPDKGDWELSAAASFMSLKFKDSDESYTSIRLAGRLGYFITKKFEIEPEIIIAKLDEDIFGEGRMGYIFSCNLAYNFTSSSKTVPFVLVGGGLSNTFPLFGDVVFVGYEDHTWKLINVGVGVKVFLCKCVALRVEYRFQHYFGKKEYEDDFTCHFGLFGISAFLK